MNILKETHCRSLGRGGFTLVEVILGIMILALGIISVQRVFIGSLAALNTIENWSQGERLLGEKIWALEREVAEKGKKFQKRSDSGLILGSDRTYQYAMNIREISPDARLMEADAVVSWGRSGMGHSIKRSFYLRAPYDADWKG